MANGLQSGLLGGYSHGQAERDRYNHLTDIERQRYNGDITQAASLSQHVCQERSMAQRYQAALYETGFRSSNPKPKSILQELQSETDEWLKDIKI